MSSGSDAQPPAAVEPPRDDDVLIFAQIGDLHLVDEGMRNHLDLQAIVSEIAAELHGLDFVYVPGDNADDGLPAQYLLAKRELARLPMPVHIVTGDHDMKPGHLDAFYGTLGADPLPKAIDAGGVRCLFLDICGPGGGGPDFRLGVSQTGWMADELKRAGELGQRCAVFMHSYPADLRGDGETDAIIAAFAAREMLLVSMGHTHYNELANDGRTVFSATRSTGQVEEGPIGYSIATIDRRTVSWRFRPLGAGMPAVLVTAPTDRRLATDAADRDHVPDGRCEVRASVLGARAIVRCVCRVDGGRDVPMRATGPGRHVGMVDLAAEAMVVTVEAEDDLGHVERESIEVARSVDLDRRRHADGSDADAIGAWPERGVLSTQLGPNRNGREW